MHKFQTEKAGLHVKVHLELLAMLVISKIMRMGIGMASNTYSH